MKQTLLIAALAAMAAPAFAMEPLTPEQLENFRICVTNQGEENAFSNSFACSLEYPDASQPETLTIQNFNSSGLPLRCTVDWENGTVKVAPYTFNSDYDYDTYEMYYEMVVNEEAANLSSPMDPDFNNSFVTGTISETELTLENWNIVKVNMYFSSMTKTYSEPQNSAIHVPNTHIEWTQMDWDDDWILVPVEYGQPMSYDIYSEVKDDVLKVYNWDDMTSCVTLYKESNEEGDYFTTNEDEVITTGKYQFGIYPLPEEEDLFWEDVDEMEPAPLVSAMVTDSKKLNFGGWLIRDYNKWYDRSYGEYAYLTFDYDIIPGYVNVAENIAPSNSVAKFYNLQGVEISEPTTGLYIKVENGKSTKVIK